MEFKDILREAVLEEGPKVHVNLKAVSEKDAKKIEKTLEDSDILFKKKKLTFGVTFKDKMQRDITLHTLKKDVRAKFKKVLEDIDRSS